LVKQIRLISNPRTQFYAINAVVDTELDDFGQFLETKGACRYVHLHALIPPFFKDPMSSVGTHPCKLEPCLLINTPDMCIVRMDFDHNRRHVVQSAPGE
jgi:hypothetical protein